VRRRSTGRIPGRFKSHELDCRRNQVPVAERTEFVMSFVMVPSSPVSD
jgi:hypothetical protein